MRFYLSGPMSGLPDENRPAFNAAAAELRAMGYHVENPATNPEQETWEDYMRLALRQMLTCDIVAQLPGWASSRGASMEHDVAQALGIPCMSVESLTSTFARTVHVSKPADRIDLGAPLEFAGVNIDAVHKKTPTTKPQFPENPFRKMA